MKYRARNEVILKNKKHIQPGEIVELESLNEVESGSVNLESLGKKDEEEVISRKKAIKQILEKLNQEKIILGKQLVYNKEQLRIRVDDDLKNLDIEYKSNCEGIEQSIKNLLDEEGVLKENQKAIDKEKKIQENMANKEMFKEELKTKVGLSKIRVDKVLEKYESKEELIEDLKKLPFEKQINDVLKKYYQG